MISHVKIINKFKIHLETVQLQIAYKGPLECIMGWDLILHGIYKFKKYQSLHVASFLTKIEQEIVIYGQTLGWLLLSNNITSS